MISFAVIREGADYYVLDTTMLLPRIIILRVCL